MIAEATPPVDAAVGLLARLFASGPQGVAIGAVIIWLLYDVATRWIDRRNGVEPAPIAETVEAVRAQAVEINRLHVEAIEDHEQRLRMLETSFARLDERTDPGTHPRRR